MDCAYGLSLGGKILSRVLERREIVIDHAIMDAAPLLPLPKWLVDPLRYYQSLNVWTCYHWTGFWRWVFHSHYFDVLLDECRKVWPGRRVPPALLFRRCVREQLLQPLLRVLSPSRLRIKRDARSGRA